MKLIHFFSAILFLSCHFAAGAQVRFIRGDVNADGAVNIGDPIFTLNYLFAGGLQPQCMAAADTNLDGAVNVGDPIYTLQYLFAGGPPPPAPFPSCGVPPGAEALPCAAFPPCEFSDDESMFFDPQGEFSYKYGTEEISLEVSHTQIAVCTVKGAEEELKSALEAEPIVRVPVVLRPLRRGIVAVSLRSGASRGQILELVNKLNGLSAVRFASPVFTAPSSRAILTNEIIVKFKEGTSSEEIHAFARGAGLLVLKEEYPLRGCCILGFTSASGPEPLTVSARLYSEAQVEYAEPNFMLLLEPPDEPPPGAAEGPQPAGGFVGEGNAWVLYPNTFMELETLSGSQFTLHPGWQTIVEEDFETATPFEGWINEDMAPGGGRYFWGRVSDAEFPDLMGEGYEAEGYKGWVAMQHSPGWPDRFPDMETESEGYAPYMDTWLIWGPMDLSGSFLVRVRLQGVFYAPSTEIFNLYASVDGENWYGFQETGVGEDGMLYYWRPRWDTDPPTRGIYFDLTRVPELGDLTGYHSVYVALRFRSDGSATPRPEPDSFSYYGLFIHNIVIEECRGAAATGISSDPFSPRQWGLKNQGQTGGTPGVDINVEEAWAVLEELPDAPSLQDERNEVIVAVLDSGVDLEHEDLNLVEGYDATYDPLLDPDHEDSRGGPFPWDGHGTACAGIIGAKRNGIGVVGVAPGVKIMPVRIAFSEEDSPGWIAVVAQFADGIRWAQRNGARILSCSWGSTFPSPVIHQAIDEVWQLGCVVVCASGNDDFYQPAFPAREPETICVGAISPCGERKNPSSCDGEWWWGSNHTGPDVYGELDLVAPGVFIPTTDISGDGGYVVSNAVTGKSGNYFMTFNGTSSACPHVAGAAALLLCAAPTLSPEAVRSILRSTASDLDPPGRDDDTGYGLLNAGAALTEVVSQFAELMFADLSVPEYFYIGRRNQVRFTILNAGQQDAGPFRIQIHLSRDGYLDASDDLLWSGWNSVAAGDSLEVTAEFLLPSDLGTGLRRLFFSADTTDSVAERNERNNLTSAEVRLIGAPNLVVKPSAVDFGVVPIGTTVQQTVQIKNEGVGELAPLRIESIELGGDSVFNHPDNVIPSGPFVLQAHQFGQMWLYFAPPEARSFSGTLTIRSNDPDEPVVVIPLSGTGFVPLPALSVTPEQIDFGDSDTEAVVVLRNNRKESLDWEISGQLPQWLNVNPQQGTLEPSAEVELHLTVRRSGFVPGSYTHQLEITSPSGSAAVNVAMTVPPEPHVTVQAVPVSGPAPLSVEFTITISGGDPPYTISWDFGDGTTSSEPNPVHVYTEPNTYIARVTVTDADGDTDSAQLTVVVTGALLSWSKSFGHGRGFTDYHTYGIAPASDGGVVVTAESMTAENGYQIWILRVDGSGSLLWERALGGRYNDAAEKLRRDPDGGYLVVGQSYSFRTGSRYCDAWIIKLSEEGSVLWQKTFGGQGTDSAVDIQPTFGEQREHNGYIVVGRTTSFGAGGYDVWVLRLDRSANILWEKAYGGNAHDFGRAVLQTPDGGFLVVADTQSFGAGSRDVWILRLAADGEVLWEKTYGGTGMEMPWAVAPTGENGWVIASSTTSFGAGDADWWVLALDSAGTLLWNYTYGGAGEDRVRDLIPSGSGGYLLVGWSDSFGESFMGDIPRDAWVLELDSNGAIRWQKIYNKPFLYEGQVVNGEDWAYGITRTADGQFAVCGDTDWLDDERSTDVWIFKIAADGTLGCGIETDTACMRGGGIQAEISGPNDYQAVETSAVVGTPSVQAAALGADTFDHCAQ